MTERPILFSGPMVRAILEGRKTQTRRVMMPQPTVAKDTDKVRYPYGQPGDRLWVRENGWQRPERTPKMMREGADTWKLYYFDADNLTPDDHADFKAWGFKRRPSIHMPRWASRITLEVVNVRVERLQEISEEDAIAEGVERAGKGWKHYFFPDEPESAWEFASNSYASLWDSLNAKRGFGWDANPWVWVVEFRRLPIIQGEKT